MNIIEQVESKYRKGKVVDVKSGDTVQVYQKIKEGSKERVQMFEGLVIRTRRKKSLSSTITVRRIASGIGVEKTFMLHSPLVEKIEVVKRSKVRRKYLSYMRERSGKSARLDSVNFDKGSVNDVTTEEVIADPTPEAVATAPKAEEAPEEKIEAPAKDVAQTKEA